MNMEFLKPLVGEELFVKLSEKLGPTGVELADIAGGAYVPKARMDETLEAMEGKARQIAALEEELARAREQAAGREALSARVEALSAEVAERDARLEAMALQYDIREALRGMNARNADVILPLLKLDSIRRGRDGRLTGLTEQVEALRQTDGYLFEDQPGDRGGFFGAQDMGAGDRPNAAMNAAIRSMSGRF